MKKNIKAVLACTAALVIAGGGYAVLMLTGANERFWKFFHFINC